MIVRSLSLRNYRNYGELDISIDSNINIFVGPNAQGKTNLLESVYYSSLGRSHRTRNDEDLIKWNEEGASFKLSVERLGVSNEIGFEFRRGSRRKVLWNGHPIRPKDLVGKLNTVLFSPEDLSIIKNGPNLHCNNSAIR